MSRKAGIIAPSPPPPCTLFELVRMVRVMELIKEYLSIDETISYLKGNGVIQADFDFLQDLERERKLTPLIYLQTNFLTNENLFLSNGKPKYYRLTGYFKPTDFILLDCYGYDERYCENRLFLYGMGGSFKVEKIIFSDTTDYLMDKTGQLCGFSRDEKAPDFFVSIYEFDLNCIRFKKTDLENLFYLQSQTDNNEILETLKKQDRHIKALIDKGEDYDLLVGRLESLTQQLQQLKAENKKLQEQLEQQANQPSDTATDDEILNYDEVKAIQAIKNEFWLYYDPKNKPVLKLVVTEWITQNYPSINPSMASWLDKIVRQKYVK